MLRMRFNGYGCCSGRAGLPPLLKPAADILILGVKCRRLEAKTSSEYGFLLSRRRRRTRGSAQSLVVLRSRHCVLRCTTRTGHGLEEKINQWYHSFCSCIAWDNSCLRGVNSPHTARDSARRPQPVIFSSSSRAGVDAAALLLADSSRHRWHMHQPPKLPCAHSLRCWTGRLTSQ